MARKLARFTNILAVPAVALGAWLWLSYGIGFGPGNAWMDTKLALVILVAVYHLSCLNLLARFADGRAMHGHVWFRWFNEVPVLLLVAIVILVVVKPF
jgi:putative membrane protein